MHMRIVHGLRANKCDECDRDTKVDTEIIENEAISDDIDEAICKITQYSDEGKASTALRDTTDENETPQEDDIDDVTSVADDRGHVDEQFEENQDILKAENDAVEEIFKPVGIMFQSSCRNCGMSDHTSERKVRRRKCSAWNIYCGGKSFLIVSYNAMVDTLQSPWIDTSVIVVVGRQAGSYHNLVLQLSTLNI